MLATKFHNSMGDGPNDRGDSRYHILRACEDSLRRLQTDRIDLYQIHRPPMANPPDETLRALDDLVHSGKVVYIGCSTHPAWMVMEALAVSERQNLARYVSEQPPYNLLDRRVENELVPLCQKYGMAILPWSPLAGGMLAGRYPPGAEYPSDSRATRSGEYFTTRISRQRTRGGCPRRRNGKGTPDDHGAACPLVAQGPAGRDRSYHRPAHAGTSRIVHPRDEPTTKRYRPSAL